MEYDAAQQAISTAEELIADASAQAQVLHIELLEMVEKDLVRAVEVLPQRGTDVLQFVEELGRWLAYFRGKPTTSSEPPPPPPPPPPRLR